MEKKEKKEKRDRTGKTVRVLSAEIVGVEKVEGAHLDSEVSLASAKKSLRAMGTCLARAMEVGFFFLNRQDASWARELVPKDQEALGVVQKTLEKVDKEGEKTETQYWGFEKDGAPSQSVLYRILRSKCPCLSSAVLDGATQILKGDYGKFRASRYAPGGQDDGRSINVYQPPYPLGFRASKIQVSEGGKRQMLITVPLRTGELCPRALEGCSCTKAKVVEASNGSTQEREIVPLRGQPTTGVRPKSVDVTFRCFVAGKKRKKSFQAFRKILSGEYTSRDCRITLQGSKGGKQSWMMRLSYERPVELKPTGQVAAAVFSFHHLIYGMTEEGRSYHRDHGEGMRRQMKAFGAMGHRAYLKDVREIGISGLIKGIQENFRDRGGDLRRASRTQTPGTVGRGSEPRLRRVRSVKGKQEKCIEWILQQSACNYARWAREEGVKHVYLLRWFLTADSLPANQRQKIVEFPRARHLELVRQKLEEGAVDKQGKAVPNTGIATTVVDTLDDISTSEDKKDKKKGRRSARELLLGCPVCGSALEYDDQSLICRSVGSDGFPCKFTVGYNEWRCLTLLHYQKVGIAGPVEHLKERREYIRSALLRQKGKEAAEAGIPLQLL